MPSLKCAPKKYERWKVRTEIFWIFHPTVLATYWKRSYMESGGFFTVLCFSLKDIIAVYYDFERVLNGQFKGFFWGIKLRF
jgi:hypothetical protein